MEKFVRIPETHWKIIKGSEVMYLTDLWFTKRLADKYVKLVQTEPLAPFYEFIAENMNAVMNGKEIAPEIEPDIINMLDDRMNRRKIAIRTGDYIALQKQFQQQIRQK